ncbi:MAG TPA: hypothetical protein VI980_03430 [Acidimicrobiia bacterium]|nr:hypothetical protein [Acidimicrobiia bacterium]
MTHIRPEVKPSFKRRMQECRRGIHDYADGQHIGAGIMRRVCKTCAGVTIDLTGAQLTFDGAIERQGASS